MTAPVASAIPAPTAVFPNLDAFVAAWNDRAADIQLVDPTIDTLVIDPSAIIRQPLPAGDLLAGLDAFAVPIGTSGFVGGLIDQATGEVTGALVGGDPDAEIVRSSVGVLLLASLDPALAGPAAEAWSALAVDTDTVQVDVVTAGDRGVTLEVVEGAEAGDNLVSVFVGPVAATPEALAAPYLAFLAAFSLTMSATTTPPSSSAAGLTSTTAAVAALPSTVVVATPTTGLPAISLALPSATTAATTTSGPPPTTAAPVAGALFASLDDLEARWNEQAAGIGAVADPSLAIDDMALVVTGDEWDVFAGWVGESSYFGGAADPETEQVARLAVVVIPSSPTASDVLAITAALVAPDHAAELMSTYRGLLDAPTGTNAYVPAGPNDLVVTVLDPSFGGANLIAVTAAPRTDEATAVDNATRLNETLPNTLTLL